ncbi:MAG: hypothetical protein CMJ78_16880 [Planctomycetaceae bacterium]|nr:hypothetical protein [Planctomycetaceae bacterium]
MATTAVATDFLEILQRSKLLTPAQIKLANSELKLNDQPTSLDAAKQLVKHGLLTRFQAKRLLEGRYRGFFIDDYKIMDILGCGGMGWVYLGRHVKTGRCVALKMLTKKNEGDAGLLARFQLEAKAGLMLNHPNIIATLKMDFTSGVYGDVHYVIMDFAKAIGLDELVQLAGPVNYAHASHIIRQTAAGLQHAHDVGLVHRDIKPANILIGHEGNAQIVDFGLSLIANDAEEFSLAMIFGHDCLGTADYIAPEQSLDSYNVDGRADIYSLGCTFYFALTGQVPFPIKSRAAKVKSHRTVNPRPISTFPIDVPGDLIDIIEKMMSKGEEDRYETAAEVGQALASFARRRPINFDYDAILAMRAAEYQHRINMNKRPQPPNSGARLTNCSPAQSDAATPTAHVDTDIRQRDDTQHR